MKLFAKDGTWFLGFRYLYREKEKYPVDLLSLAEYLGLFPEELLDAIRKKEFLHLESVNLGQFLGLETSSI